MLFQARLQVVEIDVGQTCNATANNTLLYLILLDISAFMYANVP